MPRYQLADGTSRKFWEIALEGASFTVTYGRLGAAGQRRVKAFASAEAARLAHDALVAEKLKKGYALVADGSAAAPPAPGPSLVDFVRPRFVGAVVALPEMRQLRFPRVGRVDERDAVVMYLDAASNTAKLVSHRVGNAFTDGPLELRPPVQHWRGDYGFVNGAFDAQPGGAFLFECGYETILARVDVPGAVATFPGHAVFEAAPAGGVFNVRPEEARHRVLLHRVEGNVVDFGLLPPKLRIVGLAATEGGRLVVLTSKRPVSERDDRSARCMTVWVARDGALAKGATFEVEFLPLRLATRAGGGVHVALPARTSTRLMALDEGGAIVGPALELVHPRGRTSALARMGDRLALVTSGNNVDVLVTDGARVAGTPTPLPAIVHMDGSSLAANADGARLVFAFPTGFEGRVTRLVCAPLDAAEAERCAAEMAADAALHAVAVADAATLPPARPAPPKPGRFGTRDDVVARLRQRRVLAALGRMFGGEGASIEASGDAHRGSYVGHDGCGNHLLALWDRAGVVALAFDHDSPLSEWDEPREARRPKQHLPHVPPALRGLAKRAADWGERLATEGFWIAAGPEAVHAESERVDVLKQLERDEDGEVWMRGGGRLSAIASRLAAGERAEVTADEASELLALASARRALDPRAVDLAAKELAALGVAWPDAAAAASAATARLAAGSDPSTRLLRAAHAGDLAAVVAALAAGADVDSPLPASLALEGARTGATPLLVAMGSRNARVAAHLIEAGADVDVSAGPRKSPLEIAANGDVVMMRRLLARGAKVVDATSSRLLAQVAEAAEMLELMTREHGREALVMAGGGVLPEPADFAAVTRALLDAGVPAPSGDRAAALRTAVAAAGASDLLPRLAAASSPRG